MLALQVVVTGVLLGGLYACMAIGFSVIWGVTNLINLAHGSMIITGAYVAWFLHSQFGLDPFLAVPFAAVTLFVFGYLLQRLLLNRVLGTSLFMTLILTFGLNMVMINAILIAFSADFRSIVMPYSALFLDWGGIRIPYTGVAVFGVALLLTLALHLFMNYTRTGHAIRATAQSRRAATVLGIDTQHVYAVSFGIGAAMAGAAGALIAVMYAFSPISGESYTMKSFVIVLLGGLGSIPGVIVAAILLGVAENLVAGLFSPGYRDAVSFLLLLLILMVRPRGLFGNRYLADPKV
jgi:branched-chain amino acid transport system permease protein